METIHIPILDRSACQKFANKVTTRIRLPPAPHTSWNTGSSSLRVIYEGTKLTVKYISYYDGGSCEKCSEKGCECVLLPRAARGTKRKRGT
jgi:hypothetical protein